MGPDRARSVKVSLSPLPVSKLHDPERSSTPGRLRGTVDGVFRLYGSLLDPSQQIRVFHLDRIVVTEQFSLTGQHRTAVSFPSYHGASLHFAATDATARDLALPLWFSGELNVPVEDPAFGLLGAANPSGPVPLLSAAAVAASCTKELDAQLRLRVDVTLRTLERQLRAHWSNWAVCRLDPHGLARSFLPWGGELESILASVPSLRLSRAGEVRVVPLRTAVSLAELCEARTLGVCSLALPPQGLLETGLQLWDDAGVFDSLDSAVSAAARI